MARFAFALSDPMSRDLSIEGMRQRAIRRLPRMVAAYIESVAEDGMTARRNRAAFDDHRLLPHALTGVDVVDLTTSLGAERLALPVLIAPTGLAGLVRPRGEVMLARAAHAAGTRLVLSTATASPPEAVAEATPARHWFQLYPIGDRPQVAALVKRARACGFSTLVVTVDTPVVGKREAEQANGLGFPVRLTPGRLLDLLRHPRWLAGYLRNGEIFPALYPQFARDGAMPGASARYMQNDLRWEDIVWLRTLWDGPFYIKGLLRAEDARKAVEDVGVSGVILSNHGGRQLGSTVAPLDVLPEVVRQMKGRGHILLDGGIRRGSDVVKALCLGADAVLIGRPALYGLACAGEAGVQRVLELLAEEMRITMTLLGCATIRDLSADHLADGIHPHTSKES